MGGEIQYAQAIDLLYDGAHFRLRIDVRNAGGGDRNAARQPTHQARGVEPVRQGHPQGGFMMKEIPRKKQCPYTGQRAFKLVAPHVKPAMCTQEEKALLAQLFEEHGGCIDRWRAIHRAWVGHLHRREHGIYYRTKGELRKEHRAEALKATLDARVEQRQQPFQPPAMVPSTVPRMPVPYRNAVHPWERLCNALRLMKPDETRGALQRLAIKMWNAAGKGKGDMTAVNEMIRQAQVISM